MGTAERSRTELHERLDTALGSDAADTLMGYLPPVGWADVATRSDLANLERRMEARFEALDSRFEAQLAGLETRFERALRQTVITLVAAAMASVGAAVGITQIIS